MVMSMRTMARAKTNRKSDRQLKLIRRHLPAVVTNRGIGAGRESGRRRRKGAIEVLRRGYCIACALVTIQLISNISSADT